MEAKVEADKVGVAPEAFVEVVTFDRPTEVRNVSGLLALFDPLVECRRFGIERSGGTTVRGGSTVHGETVPVEVGLRKKQVVLALGGLLGSITSLTGHSRGWLLGSGGNPRSQI